MKKFLFACIMLLAFTTVAHAQKKAVVGYNYEQAFLLLLNDRDYPIDVVFLADGSGDDVYIDQKKVVREALMHKSTKIILAHSHPAGSASPSYADLIATQKLSDLLAPMGIRIMDHLIFAARSCCSISQHEDITDDILAFSPLQDPKKNRNIEGKQQKTAMQKKN